MIPVLAFDVYGTLFDVSAVENEVRKIAGESARSITAMWRSKQLEYSFRRALMKRHADFSVCSAQALDHAFAYHRCALSDSQKHDLLGALASLPAFPDVIPALKSLAKSGCRMYAFSNGSRESVEILLNGAGLAPYFDGIVSAAEITSFKPDPAVYAHFLDKAGTDINDAWLVSSNPFDVMGAVSFGMKAAWIRRNESDVFDPWEINPTLTLGSLSEIEHTLRS